MRVRLKGRFILWSGVLGLLVGLGSPEGTRLQAQMIDVPDLPPGAGRELVIEHCTVCHSAAIIVQNRMTRKKWDRTLTWMQDEQGMPPLKPGERDRILDYLARVQGIETGPGSGDPPSSAPSRLRPLYRYNYPPNPL